MLWEKLSRARTNYFRLFGAKKIRLANLTDGPKLKTRHASLIFFYFFLAYGNQWHSCFIFFAFRPCKVMLEVRSVGAIPVRERRGDPVIRFSTVIPHSTVFLL